MICYGRFFLKWKVMLLFLLFSQTFSLSAQVPETTSGNMEQQIENLTGNIDDGDIEDDSYLQQMQQYLKHPVNMNTADESELKELRILTPLQIRQIITYREFFGNFISVYELQSVPSLDIETIQKIRPFISIHLNENLFIAAGKRFKSGEHTILLRASQGIEKSKGFIIDSSYSTNFYPGSPQKFLIRYRYQFKNLLQYGLLGEKDAGEQFFKGNQNAGFDFYSAHFFLRNIGMIRSLALGDFTVNLGQGLIQWQSLAFKKGPDVMNIKRQSNVLRPYNSAGEINFHRGAAITFAKRNWEATAFASYKKIDANFVADTSQSKDDFISSLQTSGYHRTKSENEDKGIQNQFVFGGNLSFQLKKLHIGVNTVQYQFKLPLQKDMDPYNKYALSGKSFGNFSMDYSYSRKNLYFFGEAAFTNKLDMAFINGLLISTAANVDFSLLYRNIQRGYQSLYTNAFTESTYPNNEKGLFTGISIRPSDKWKLDAYVDFYKFPWLRYRVDAPTTGSDYMVQVTYKPSKQLEIYSRYRTEAKALNYNPDLLILSPVIAKPRQSWRTQLNCRINIPITLRTRTEILWFDKKGKQPEQGFLTYLDFLFKPMLKPFSGSIRLQYFETDSYNSRLYAYENDVLYSYSIPVFYDKGLRYYLNCNFDINRKISLWTRWAQTIYRGKTLIGSGLDEIKGNKKTEIKLQLMYRF